MDFKTGTFEFTTTVDGDEVTTTFERTNDIEVDYFKGRQDSSTVKWINDCEYILKRINPKSRAEEKPIHIKILTTTNSSYTFEFNTVGDAKKLRGTAIKKH
ncbi:MULTISPECIES: DNA topoisomerase IV [Croceitalea]|uniref:DNA topoisomerase IV n=1 Tax=Croceitalea vernalis TaxID=3075599 RepID=A0ABU3BH01_9FLAO|nr:MULTISPECIES: DNA topoisomerase IV [unclassified Croceitalea]MDT0539622.1 DNA topoisomerase IV [Croceitalea sp. P059]MDT0621414.1 DNA topoisomerase IV [Croceitalea sp. P007]